MPVADARAAAATGLCLEAAKPRTVNRVFAWMASRPTLVCRIASLARLAAVAFTAVAACSSGSPAAPSTPSDPNQGGATVGIPDAAGTSKPSDAGKEAGFLSEGGADLLAVLSACPVTPSAGDFPSDVAAVLRAKCQTCHKKPPINHAPFPLLNYEDALVPDPIPPYAGRPIWQAMHAVIQPTGVPHMPLGKAPQLTAAEAQTLDGWLTACAMPVAEGTGGDVDSASSSPDAAMEVQDAAVE